jgi:hypothetical protein
MTWVIKADLVVLTVDFAVLLALSLLLQQEALTIVRNGYFPKILILESGVAFLIGGLTALSSSLFASKVREHFFSSNGRWSENGERKAEKKANLYILVAVVLFLESILASSITV